MSKFVDFYLIGELVDSHGNVHYEDLKNLPTADVVEVIRCEDCRYRFKNKWFCCDGRCLDDDNFCNYGERREDDKGRNTTSI